MRSSVLILTSVVVVGLSCSSEVTVVERYTHGREIGERLEKTLEEHGFRIRELQLFTIDPPEPCPKEMKRRLQERLRSLLAPYLSDGARWTLYVTRITFNRKQAPRYILTIEAKLEDFDGRCAWRKTIEKRTLAEGSQSEEEIQDILLVQCSEALVEHLPLTQEPPEKVGE